MLGWQARVGAVTDAKSLRQAYGLGSLIIDIHAGLGLIQTGSFGSVEGRDGPSDDVASTIGGCEVHAVRIWGLLSVRFAWLRDCGGSRLRIVVFFESRVHEVVECGRIVLDRLKPV